MPIKTVTIAPHLTIEVTILPVGGGHDFVRVDNDHSIEVGRIGQAAQGHIGLGFYEFDIAAVSTNVIPTDAVFESLELEFWTHNCSPEMLRLEVVGITGLGRLGNSSDAMIWIRGFVAPANMIYAIIDPTGQLVKRSWTVSLGVGAIEQLRQSFAEQRHFTVCLRRPRPDVFNDPSVIPNDTFGSIEVGGLTLKEGIEWGRATGSDIVTPPLLYVTYSTADENRPIIEMFYTTDEPLTSQKTPSNSIGGYKAFNQVYPTAKLGGPIDSSQTTIPLSSGSPLPTRTGLAAIGPEIFKYEGIDVTNNQLTSVTRGISPNAFPAGVDSYGNLELINYLHVDQETDSIRGDIDVHQLFDTPATDTLLQYRCVAIFHTGRGSTVDFPIKDVRVFIFQDLDSDVQIDIGIEVPLFDSHEGRIDAIESEQIFSDSAFDRFETGLFAGAFIRFPNIPATQIIDTFDSGEFILQSPISGLATAQPFTINPAPAQRIVNDFTGPTTNAGRFLGFNSGGSVFVNLIEHGNVMQPHDLFYVWVKRVLKKNADASADTGAIISIQYSDAVEVT